MKKTWTRVLAAMLCILMLLSIIALSGCQKEQNDDGDNTTPPDSTTGDDDDTTKPTLADPEAIDQVAVPFTNEQREGIYEPVQEINEEHDLYIPIGTLNDNQMIFMPISVDGWGMEIIAYRDPDGGYHVAYNMCPKCFMSGMGFYCQQGENIVCQNCGLVFPLSIMDGTNDRGTDSCHPWALPSDKYDIVKYNEAEFVEGGNLWVTDPDVQKEYGTVVPADLDNSDVIHVPYATIHAECDVFLGWIPEEYRADTEDTATDGTDVTEPPTATEDTGDTQPTE